MTQPRAAERETPDGRLHIATRASVERGQKTDVTVALALLSRRREERVHALDRKCSP